MLAPVAPLDHVTVPVQLADKVIFPPPQITFDVEFDVINGAAITFTTTVTEFDFGLIQVSLILHCAVYVVVVLGVTVTRLPI